MTGDQAPVSSIWSFGGSGHLEPLFRFLSESRFLPSTILDTLSTRRGFDLISDVLPFGRLWYTTIPDAIDYAKHRSRAHDAVNNVCDAAGNVIGDDEHLGDFKAVAPLRRLSRERNFCVEKPN
ncbi:MAG TPA: hypothetical protein VKK81_09845 [Candidatus Binatia bacterium]|nr:hypothetical protein [Candidatus Binatia bacterium]